MELRRHLVTAAYIAAGSLFVPGFVQQAPGQRTQASTPRARGVVARTGAASFLGVGVAEIDSERAKALNLKEERGVEIKSVEPESPAAKAGLKEGDVILEYNGQAVEGNEQFVRLIRETPVGRQARLSIWRNGGQQALTATIGARDPGFFRFGEGVEIAVPRIPEIRLPDMPRAYTSWRSPTLGIESESLGSQLAEYFGVKDGVLVRSVTKDSAAEKAGLKAGDVITRIDDQRVAGPREVSSALRGMQAKKSFQLTIVRDRKEMTLTVTLDDAGFFRERGRSVVRVDGNQL